MGGGRRRAEEEVEQRKVEVGGARVCGGGRDMYTPVVGLARYSSSFRPQLPVATFFLGVHLIAKASIQIGNGAR